MNICPVKRMIGVWQARPREVIIVGNTYLCSTSKVFLVRLSHAYAKDRPWFPRIFHQ